MPKRIPATTDNILKTVLARSPTKGWEYSERKRAVGSGSSNWSSGRMLVTPPALRLAGTTHTISRMLAFISVGHFWHLRLLARDNCAVRRADLYSVSAQDELATHSILRFFHQIGVEVKCSQS